MREAGMMVEGNNETGGLETTGTSGTGTRTAATSTARTSEGMTSEQNEGYGTVHTAVRLLGTEDRVAFRHSHLPSLDPREAAALIYERMQERARRPTRSGRLRIIGKCLLSFYLVQAAGQAALLLSSREGETILKEAVTVSELFKELRDDRAFLAITCAYFGVKSALDPEFDRRWRHARFYDQQRRQQQPALEERLRRIYEPWRWLTGERIR